MKIYKCALKLVLSFIVFSSCKPSVEDNKIQSKTIAVEQKQVELEIETKDITVPYPVQVILSLTQGTPIFEDNKGVITSISQNQKAGIDRIKVAIRAMNDDLKSALKMQNGGDERVFVEKGASYEYGSLPDKVHKLHGVCINDTTYVLGALNISDDRKEYDISYLGKLPSTYRPSLKGCRNRFLELVNIKFKEKLEVSRKLDTIETLNFAFNFIPGYAGAENLSKGNAVLGTAEIVADIATIGVASKYKAGWRSLSLSKRMHRYVEGGMAISALSANAVRLGSVIDDVHSRGAQVSDIPTIALLVAESGFVLFKVKVKLSYLNRAKKTLANLDARVLNSLSEALPKIGKRLKRVQKGAVKNIFNGKYKGLVSKEEINEIAARLSSGGDVDIIDLHKLISNSTPRRPQALINVTNDVGFVEIINSGAKYHGYMGFPGLPKGIYATSKPISWNTLDLISTAGGSTSNRNTMMVFVGSAKEQFSKIRQRGASLGSFTAKTKSIAKPLNPEFATVKDGDVLFRNFEVITDGQKNIVIVKDIEILDSLQGFQKGTPEYKKLNKVKINGNLALAIIGDATEMGIVVSAGALSASSAALISQRFSSWLFAEE